jgi:hypothetical protein
MNTTDHAPPWTGTCRRCSTPLTEETRLASREEPYCLPCWFITFYEFPEKRLERIMAQLGRMEAFGIGQEEQDRILMGELRRHAQRKVEEKLQRITDGDWSPRLRALMQQKGSQ